MDTAGWRDGPTGKISGLWSPLATGVDSWSDLCKLRLRSLLSVLPLGPRCAILRGRRVYDAVTMTLRSCQGEGAPVPVPVLVPRSRSITAPATATTTITVTVTISWDIVQLPCSDGPLPFSLYAADPRSKSLLEREEGKKRVGRRECETRAHSCVRGAACLGWVA